MVRHKANQSHRALGDGSVIRSVPGNELPGYDHSVPSGHEPQSLLTTNRKSRITNHDFSFLAVARSNDVRIRLMAWSISASDLRKKLIQPLSGKI